MWHKVKIILSSSVTSCCILWINVSFSILVWVCSITNSLFLWLLTSVLIRERKQNTSNLPCLCLLLLVMRHQLLQPSRGLHCLYWFPQQLLPTQKVQNFLTVPTKHRKMQYQSVQKKMKITSMSKYAWIKVKYVHHRNTLTYKTNQHDWLTSINIRQTTNQRRCHKLKKWEQWT